MKKASSKNFIENKLMVIHKIVCVLKFNKNLEREKDIAQKLKNNHNQNIIKYLDIYDSEKKVYFFMEMCDFTLGSYIKIRNYKFGEYEILDLLFQISSGYLKLIELGIIHRDIKLENIVISFNSNKKPIYKIIDFGRSKIETINMRIQTPLQSSLNTAPESNTKNYDNTCDVYSLGLVVLQMIDFEMTQDYSSKKVLDSLIAKYKDLTYFSRNVRVNQLYKNIPESVWSILVQMICPEERRINWFKLNQTVKQKLVEVSNNQQQLIDKPQQRISLLNGNQKNYTEYDQQDKLLIRDQPFKFFEKPITTHLNQAFIKPNQINNFQPHYKVQPFQQQKQQQYQNQGLGPQNMQKLQQPQKFQFNNPQQTRPFYPSTQFPKNLKFTPKKFEEK